MNLELTEEKLQDYRARTFRTLSELRVTTQNEAIEFANERGFIYFWPIKNITLPSLWVAVAGDRPVPNAHDDPGHVTWGWKDNLLDKRQWYYAKVLRNKATIISLSTAPYFYALSENYGDPAHDYLQLYEDGLMSHEAKSIFEAILEEGPLDTINLRRVARLSSDSSKSAFDRGLTELQRDFKVLPVGVAQTGTWNYSFIYEAVHRHYPDLSDKAGAIKRRTARAKLVQLYFASVGAATLSETRKLFQWNKKDLERALNALVEAGELRAGCRVEGSDAEYFVLSELL